MTAIVILNAAFATLVVAGILSLLGWGIVADRRRAARRAHRLAG